MRKDEQKSLTSQIWTRSCICPQSVFLGVRMRTYSIQSCKYCTEKLSKLKCCTCDSLIQEWRTPYFSLKAEVNNETKHPSEICIYHLQEAPPNNQWQLGWQANFWAKPQGIWVYFRLTVDSKGQRKNKLSKQCHATTNLCWPSRK